MLDNFSIENTREAVKIVDGRVEIESSGGITEKTIRSYAECGVDYISVGALTSFGQKSRYEPESLVKIMEESIQKQLNLDKRYMRMALIWAENSYCKRRQVGAILVKDKMIISDGYNGTPSGFENVCEDENI
jgi:deoxycytidylate deaminase